MAQMEFRHGDVERGRTIFENLISSFPKRTDVWSIYIDMLVQLERFDEARWGKVWQECCSRNVHFFEAAFRLTVFKKNR